MTRQQRVFRLAFEGDEDPTYVVITPAADWLFGYGCSGYSSGGNGPLEVHGQPERAGEYPRRLVAISQPWMVMEYDDYKAMVEQ